MSNRTFINTEENYYTSIDDFSKEIKPSKFYGKFFYYKCDVCGEIKSKRIYSTKTDLNVEFTCRECKYRKTSLERYGVDSPSKVKEIIEKGHKTMMERYGTVSTAQFIDYSKIDYQARNEKSKKTCLEKYGVDNAAKADCVKETTKQNNLKKYGVEYPQELEEVKEKQRQTFLKNYGSFNNLPGPKATHEKFIKYRKEKLDEDIEWIDSDSFRGKYDNAPIYYTFKCNKCGNIFKDDFHSGEPVCRVCNPTFQGRSNQEDELYEYIKSIYSGEIERHNKTILDSKKELDIYLPELNIAIEYNGIFWHGYSKWTKVSIKEFERKFQEKRNICCNKGIRLITINEYDWTTNRQVFERFLQDLLLPKTTIYARKCLLKEIDTKTAKEFCEKYHLNGFRGGSVKYGLFYDNELLAVSIFCENKKYGYECSRLVFKTGYKIIGGWDKIIKHFGKRFLHYIDLRYFNGENKTGCGWRLWKNGTILSRQQIQKDKYKKFCKNIDESLSNLQNCLLNGWTIIFDCGNDYHIYN